MSDFSSSPPDKDVKLSDMIPNSAMSANDSIRHSFSADGLSFGLGRPGTFDDLDDVEPLSSAPAVAFKRSRLDEDTLGNLGMLRPTDYPTPYAPPEVPSRRKHPRYLGASTDEGGGMLASYSVDVNNMATLGSSSLDALHDMFRSNAAPILPSTTDEYWAHNMSASSAYIPHQDNKRHRSNVEPIPIASSSSMPTSTTTPQSTQPLPHASISDTEYIRRAPVPEGANNSNMFQYYPSANNTAVPMFPYNYTSNYNYSATSNNNSSSSNRGKYRCGRCGQPKVNHVCLFVEVTEKRSIAVQSKNAYYTPAELLNEKTITVGSATTTEVTSARLDELRSIKILHPSMMTTNK